MKENLENAVESASFGGDDRRAFDVSRKYWAKVSMVRRFDFGTPPKWEQKGLHVGAFHADRNCHYLQVNDPRIQAISDVTSMVACLHPCSVCVKRTDGELVRRRYAAPMFAAELDASEALPLAPTESPELPGGLQVNPGKGGCEL